MKIPILGFLSQGMDLVPGAVVEFVAEKQAKGWQMVLCLAAGPSFFEPLSLGRFKKNPNEKRSIKI